ncbi:MAG TPA: helix-turn-helix domain-containing protein [Phenylobacterium sp.]|nr:helix-turn-helix domain-containing protein [Phenylobacterium sp.]
MLSLAIAERPRHVPRMAKPPSDDEEAELLGLALRALRTRAKISQAKAGEAFSRSQNTTELGITAQGWGRYEAGKAPGIFRPDIQRQLAEAVGATHEEFLQERARLARTGLPPGYDMPLSRAPALSAGLPIRRRVQAGAWRAVEDIDQDRPRTFPASPEPRYGHARQWLSEVVGDSMNLAGIAEGDLVHCVDALDIGYHPRTGDIVEVERVRFQGREVEVSLKQVEVTPDRVLLWPVSDNPRWKAPLELTEGLGENEEVEVQIRGLVLNAIRRFHMV